jgi:hypothetical protein
MLSTVAQVFLIWFLLAPLAGISIGAFIHAGAVPDPPLEPLKNYKPDRNSALPDSKSNS